MDIKKVIGNAGGPSAIATAINNHEPDESKHVSKQSVFGWGARGSLPVTEWTGKTRYADIICGLLNAYGHDVTPLELCPGSGQYMQHTQEKAA